MINSIGSGASVLHSMAFDAIAFSESQGQYDRMLARFVAPVIAPTFKFQTLERKTHAVDEILAIDPPRLQALALSRVANYLGDLDSGNRARVINRAVEFVRDPPDDLAQSNAANALLKGYYLLNTQQRAQLTVDYLQSVSALSGQEPLAPSTARHVVEPSPFNHTVGQGGPIAHLGAMRSAAEHLNRAENEARADLASFRSRERSDRGR
ncbi:virulence protein [Rhizobium leguminosarum]|nr:virulence protein [Rhizobium leguminosarum]